MPQTQSQPEPSTDRPAACTLGVDAPSEAPSPEPWGVQRELTHGLLALRSERRGACHVLAASGELDLATTHAFEEELKAVEATDAAEITLDLSDLGFIDSAGLRLVITACSRSSANGNRLRLRRGPPQVQRIFDITAMTDLLPFEPVAIPRLESDSGDMQCPSRS